jgi:hypothetical protein
LGISFGIFLIVIAVVFWICGRRGVAVANGEQTVKNEHRENGILKI